MDIFWQITFVESLLNLAVFAVAVIAFGLVYRFAMRLRPRSELLAQAAVGGLFGLATATAMLMPVHMSGGASTGNQTMLLTLAAPLAGPAAAIVALACVLAAQFLPLLEGALVDWVGPATALAAAGVGIIFRFCPVSRCGKHEAALSYFHFPILGLASAITGIGILWSLQGWDAARDSGLAAVLTGMLGCTMLGTLLLHETRRYKAEQELRDSRTRLAARTRELAEARDLAEQANRSKSAFLANMSHELRTPLNAILGFSEMIAQESLGPVGEPRYKEYAGDIHASGAHLLSLINDLLDVAKIEAGKMEISPNPLDAQGIFDSVGKLIGIKAREKGQVLTLEVLAGAPALFADERAVKQILINVISNAIKFAPAHGIISVTAEAAKDGGFMIVCEDNGPGIAPDKIVQIFTPFAQADNRYDRKEGGTGLGLSLVKGLMELHGGRAWLESDYGKGTRACVVFPAQPHRRIGKAA